jgi:glycerate 2-kinase
VIVLAAADAGAAHAAAALADPGGPGALGGARVVVLVGPGDAAGLPRGVLAEPGARFVLEALAADARLRAARAVVVGTGRLDDRSLRGAVEGELAVRARQAGVPCHAVVGERALDLFATRMLDLQRIVEATTPAEIEARVADAIAPVL